MKLGILLSIVLRILFILVGMGLVQRFNWILYVFGALLIWTAYKMLFTAEDEQIDPKNNILYKQASKMFPLDPDPHTPSFFTKINGKIHITSVLLVFLVIGSTDVLFATDSIPAIIGVIKEGSSNVLTLEEENFLAITSNVFAVMGLVSLFFGLKGIMGMFRFLKHGVSFILFFIGVKMMLGFVPAVEHFFKAHSWVSLAVIVATLVLSIVVSAILKEEAEEAEEATAAEVGAEHAHPGDRRERERRRRADPEPPRSWSLGRCPRQGAGGGARDRPPPACLGLGERGRRIRSDRGDSWRRGHRASRLVVLRRTGISP